MAGSRSLDPPVAAGCCAVTVTLVNRARAASARVTADVCMCAPRLFCPTIRSRGSGWFQPVTPEDPPCRDTVQYVVDEPRLPQAWHDAADLALAFAAADRKNVTSRRPRRGDADETSECRERRDARAI